MASVEEHRKRAVATRNRIVTDPSNGTLRQIVAGQPVPADLVDADDGDVSVVDEENQPGRIQSGSSSRKASTKAGGGGEK